MEELLHKSLSSVPSVLQKKTLSEQHFEMGWDGKNKGRGGRGGGRRGGRGGGGGGWKERRPPPAPTNTDCPVQVLKHNIEWVKGDHFVILRTCLGTSPGSWT